MQLNPYGSTAVEIKMIYLSITKQKTKHYTWYELEDTQNKIFIDVKLFAFSLEKKEKKRNEGKVKRKKRERRQKRQIIIGHNSNKQIKKLKNSNNRLQIQI